MLSAMAPRYLSNVRYPAFHQLYALLQKKIRINERMGFTVRFEALNALNAVVFWRSGRRCNGY